jgi:AcrR family transcriptional regulator
VSVGPETATVDVQQAREKILETAAQLFAENGYETTSLSQVARQAKVSKALIFWHFDNKEKLYRNALRKTLEPYFIEVDDLAGLGEQAQISRLIERFYDFVNENVYSVRFFLSLVVRSEYQQDEGVNRVNELYRIFRSSLADTIERGCDGGVFRADVDSFREASLIMVTLAGIFVQQFMSGESADHARDLIEHLKLTLFQRLTTAVAGSPAAGRLE